MFEIIFARANLYKEWPIKNVTKVSVRHVTTYYFLSFIVHAIKYLRKIGKILHNIVPTAKPIALRHGGRSKNLVGK